MRWELLTADRKVVAWDGETPEDAARRFVDSEGTCSAEGCESGQYSRGFCNRHYRAALCEGRIEVLTPAAGLGPEWTPGERARETATGRTCTIAAVHPVTIEVVHDDGERNTYSPAEFSGRFEPLPLET